MRSRLYTKKCKGENVGNHLFTAIAYISQSQYFWLSMGFTTAIAMFIGVLLYDGNVKNAAKGLATVISYMTMILTTSLSRIIEMGYAQDKGYQAFAGTATILTVTFFYLLGLLLGVIEKGVLVRLSQGYKKEDSCIAVRLTNVSHNLSTRLNNCKNELPSLRKRKKNSKT
jgi:hypothetical protein